MMTKGETKVVKLRIGNYMYAVTLVCTGTRIETKFPYNPALQVEIKNMQGAKYHGFDEKNPRKMWSIANSFRNWFQLQFLMGDDPYKWYDRPLVKHEYSRDLMGHQKMLADNGLTYHYMIWAAEMGTGKTLAAIEVAERCGYKDIWYIGPRSGVKAVTLELKKWDCKIKIRMMTYEQLVNIVASWKPGDPAPQMCILDECSKIKTPTAKRSQAAYHVTEAMRNEHGIENSICLLLSGTPAPKSPVDWFHLCVTGDSLISTSEGILRADELRRPFEAVVNGKEYSSNGFWSNGVKDCIKIKTKEGYEVTCTPDHRILTDFDGLQMWQEASKCLPGTKLVLNNNNGYEWDGIGSFEDGYLIGLMLGDGSIGYSNSSTLSGKIMFFKGDESIINVVCQMFPDTPNITGDIEKQLVINGGHLTELVTEWGISDQKIINYSMLRASSEFHVGLLRGLFDSDGSANKNNLQVIFSQADIPRLNAVRQLLINLGIKSKLEVVEKGLRNVLNGKNMVGKELHRLIITSMAAVRFDKAIGFFNTSKAINLKSAISRRRINTPYSHTCEVVSIEDAGKREVFDCEVEKIHCFSANGIIVHNCEVACPGFLREGDIHKFKNRLCLVEQRESLSGGMYPHLVTWFDDENKCAKCGQFADHGNHAMHSKQEASDAIAARIAQHGFKFGGGGAEIKQADVKASSVGPHAFVKSKNEVAYLFERMKGLVVVLFKKDCMDLPEKRYVEVKAQPTVDMIRAARMIVAQARGAAQTLTLLRELSDGFQYEEVETGEVECDACCGKGEREIPVPLEDVDYVAPNTENGNFKLTMMPCDKCEGSGKMPKMSRQTNTVVSPKDEVLSDLLEEHEEVGRCIVWGGFQATIDRLVELCHKDGWSTLRIDGRGYHATDALGNVLDANECLIAMDASHKMRDSLREKHDKLCVVSNAKAGGMALTFTASPSEIFYSNGFDGEARFQAEDRFHRRGADANRGCTIYDIICLPSDLVVLNNLKKKKKLQDMTLGEIQNAFK